MGRIAATLIVVTLFGTALLVEHVTAAGPERMQVAILADTSAATAAAITYVRSSLVAFVDLLPADAEIAIVSTGRRVQIRVPPTADHAKAKDSLKGLSADGGATRLMDALREVDDRFLRKAADRRPVIVVLSGDGADSSLDRDAEAFNGWLRGLPARGVVVHALIFKTGVGMAEQIATTTVHYTGGYLDTTGSGQLLQEKLAPIAELIARADDRLKK